MTTSETSRSRRWRPIRWLRAHEVAADAMLAVLLTALSLTFHLIDPDIEGETFRDPSWWTVPLVVGAVLPIAWRRSRPIPTALFVVAVEVVALLSDVNGTGLLGVVVALYSLGAHATGRRRTHAVVAISVVLSLLFISGIFADELDIGGLISITVILITAFVLGDNLRRRREAARELQDRLDRAERERELVAHQRVTAERNRIARELHDVVAHSVSVMVIQAAAARRNLASSPEVSEEALSNIEATGRQTMDELRGVLGVLRRNEQPVPDSDHPLSPQPTLQSVPALVDAATDLPIELVVSGVIEDLPSGVDLTGYRIVQEALTNVRRHAGPVSAVTVRVERSDDQVSIEIVDDGRGAAADGDGGGYGLQGMNERVQATGGTVVAGWRPGGGWRVRAALPIGRPARLDPATDVKVSR